MLWRTKLQYAADCAPQILINTASGEKEILIQDTANNIYLLNRTGEILFSKNIGEKILGRVLQIDYYNNGKQQYLFNSARHVYLIDREGNSVASYPLRLAYPASAGLSLSEHARYYVPCSNGAIYGFEKNGRPLAGYSPRSGTGVINIPMRCTAYGRTEALIALNGAGKLMLMDNKGAIRWSINNLVPEEAGFSFINRLNDFVLLNVSGSQLLKISSDGNEKIKPLVDSAFSITAMAISDSGYSYFYGSSKEVRLYNEMDEFINAVSLSGFTISSMEIISSSGTNYLRVNDAAENKIAIYSADLKSSGTLNGANPKLTQIIDLFGRHELISIQSGTGPYVSCSRIELPVSK